MVIQRKKSIIRKEDANFIPGEISFLANPIRIEELKIHSNAESGST